jgi:RimJ/RimL family protein N-acetyltransferase
MFKLERVQIDYLTTEEVQEVYDLWFHPLALAAPDTKARLSRLQAALVEKAMSGESDVAYCKRLLRDCELYLYRCYVKSNNEFMVNPNGVKIVGVITLVPYGPPARGIRELGYSIHPDLWGMGHGANMLNQFAYEEKRKRWMNRDVRLLVHRDNVRSIKCLAKVSGVTETKEGCSEGFPGEVIVFKMDLTERKASAKCWNVIYSILIRLPGYVKGDSYSRIAKLDEEVEEFMHECRKACPTPARVRAEYIDAVVTMRALAKECGLSDDDLDIDIALDEWIDRNEKRVAL